MKIRAVVFDFDGVLVESNDEKMRAFEDLFALYPEHRDVMMEYHLAHFSSPRMAKFEHYARELMTGSDSAEAIAIMAKRFSSLVVSRVTRCADVPGATEFLAELSGRLPLYVSSLTPEDELTASVHARGWSHVFSRVFGNPPHSKEDAIGWILKHEGVTAPETLFIGDSLADAAVAARTGVEFIARDSGLPLDGFAGTVCADLHEVAAMVRDRVAIQTLRPGVACWS